MFMFYSKDDVYVDYNSVTDKFGNNHIAVCSEDINLHNGYLEKGTVLKLIGVADNTVSLEVVDDPLEPEFLMVAIDEIKDKLLFNEEITEMVSTLESDTDDYNYHKFRDVSIGSQLEIVSKLLFLLSIGCVLSTVKYVIYDNLKSYEADLSQLVLTFSIITSALLIVYLVSTIATSLRYRYESNKLNTRLDKLIEKYASLECTVNDIIA